MQHTRSKMEKEKVLVCLVLLDVGTNCGSLETALVLVELET